MNVHAVINELCRRAERIAPRMADETLGAAATNPRPVTGPRRQQAWDLVAEAHDLNRRFGDRSTKDRKWIDETAAGDVARYEAMFGLTPSGWGTR